MPSENIYCEPSRAGQPRQSHGYCGGLAKSSLTLAKKFDKVHRNTTTSSSAIPSVRRAIPPRPSFALTPDEEAVVPLESMVLAEEQGDREFCLPAPAATAAIMPAAECDLRRADEASAW